jgi:hypothetical protein
MEQSSLQVCRCKREELEDSRNSAAQLDRLYAACQEALNILHCVHARVLQKYCRRSFHLTSCTLHAPSELPPSLCDTDGAPLSSLHHTTSLAPFQLPPPPSPTCIKDSAYADVAGIFLWHR